MSAARRSWLCTPATSRWRRTCGLKELSRQTAGLTGADLANICNEAAISAGRAGRDRLTYADFCHALERVVAGLEQRKLITDKEKRVIAYHEAGHALIAHLTSEEIHKVTILPRGPRAGDDDAAAGGGPAYGLRGRTGGLAQDRLGGRAAEQVVFGRITNGAASDLDHATSIARMMVFDWGMGATTRSLQMRADDYSLSEETKRLRDREQREITERAPDCGRCGWWPTTGPSSTGWRWRCWSARRCHAPTSPSCCTTCSRCPTPPA